MKVFIRRNHRITKYYLIIAYSEGINFYSSGKLLVTRKTISFMIYFTDILF